jgi:hypothetical protein
MMANIPNNDCVKFNGDLMQTDGALEFFQKSAPHSPLVFVD